MTNHDVLRFSCPHNATAEERERDPLYLFCNAAPGEPCRWSRRFDGLADPAFHSERLEAAIPQSASASTPSHATFDRAVLETGMV